jgi:hypothetical protein
MGRFDEDSPGMGSGWTKRQTRIGAISAVAVFISVVLLVGVTLPRDGVDQQDEQALPKPAQAVVPTISWVDFYGLESTIDGQPLPVGAVIRAYDPQGVVCGEFSVTRAGWYGLMPVYGDDLLTEVDEGAVPGDRIKLTINGVAATVMGPDESIWTAFGDLKQVNLAVSARP